jgi:CBS domain containing-hemolysin-like protein
MTWDAVSSGFLMAMFKFLFASAYLEGVYSHLTFLEVLLITFSGAFFCFNIFYWSAEFFMKLAKKRKLKAIQSGKIKKNKSFTRVNKTIVRIKLSKSGLYTLSTLGVLFLSIPVGGIVIAKFYGETKKAYLLSVLTIFVAAVILAFFSGVISDFIRN